MPNWDAEAAFCDVMARLGPFEPQPRIAVAVSGGADSLALMLLLKGWCDRLGGDLQAITVDHALRPESAAEAKDVAEIAKSRAIPHRILTWKGSKPQGAIQEAARKARYDLLTEYCREEGILHLALAHHQEDQVETLALRLERGSGLRGLAAMAPSTRRQGVRLIRPLLRLSKESLRGLLEARQIHPIEDPSNQDSRHKRVALRQLFQASALRQETYSEVLDLFQRLRAWEDDALKQALASALTVSPAGFVRLSQSLFERLPLPLVESLFRELLPVLAGGGYAPGGDALEALAGKLSSGEFAPFTMGGCLFLRRGDAIVIAREPAAVGGSLRLGIGQQGLWDGRFRIAFSQREEGAFSGVLEVSSFGQRPWGERLGRRPDLLELDLPPEARASLPLLKVRQQGLEDWEELPNFSSCSFFGKNWKVDCWFEPTRSCFASGFTV